jgi:hypothetical protein
MELKQWVDRWACKSRLHCVACRDTGPAGAEFRQAVAASHAPPPGWECPFGVPWDVQGETTPRPQIQPLPRAEWPRLARWLARLATPADAGLGDVFQRWAAKLGGERYKRTYRALMGEECGCADRQRRLNERFPLR